MEYVEIIRERIERLRIEIADIRLSIERQTLQGGSDAEAQLVHDQRQTRLQAIQRELVQLAGLGPKIQPTEEMPEKHRSRLHLKVS